jgi:hypothetical protein
MQGVPLRDTIASDAPIRQAALFGMFGAHVNATDGRYVYMRAPVAADNGPLCHYTLMPAHMTRPFDLPDLQDIEIAGPFSFTKGCRLMRIRSTPWIDAHAYGTMLFDLHTDPKQERPLQDSTIEATMIDHLLRLMQWNDAPPEQYQRLELSCPPDLDAPSNATASLDPVPGCSPCLRASVVNKNAPTGNTP